MHLPTGDGERGTQLMRERCPGLRDGHRHARDPHIVTRARCPRSVFGDIGTSLLSAFQAAIATGVGTDQGDILGLLLFFLWALILIVGVKYIALVCA